MVTVSKKKKSGRTRIASRNLFSTWITSRRYLITSRIIIASPLPTYYFPSHFSLNKTLCESGKFTGSVGIVDDLRRDVYYYGSKLNRKMSTLADIADIIDGQIRRCYISGIITFPIMFDYDLRRLPTSIMYLYLYDNIGSLQSCTVLVSTRQTALCACGRNSCV